MALKHADVEQRGGSRTLIVAIHAFSQTRESLHDVLQAIGGEPRLADADLLMPSYPSSIWSNADPVLIADELVQAIDRAIAARRERDGGDYEEVILVGHSLGALLIRKAYAIARGATEELVGVVGQPRPWVGRVTRLVLLAGVNRGWSLQRRPRHMPWLTWLGLRLLLWLISPLPIGRLILAARHGSPFVANLRIQWLRLVHSGSPPPLTIQVLGNKDDIVSTDDNADVAVAHSFIFLRVASTGHLNAIDFSSAEGQVRKAVFLRALVTPASQLTSDLILPVQADPLVQHVVFIMHGIRDRGHWTDDMAVAIQQAGKARGLRVAVCIASYGYFPMGPFLLLNQRQRFVRWFMDQYTEYLARYPSAEFHFVGHSNGTYLLASALERYVSCRFANIVFAGSVVRTDFPWDELAARQRVKNIRNMVATRDAVVGIFPGFFEFLGLGDIGSAGHNGFSADFGRQDAVEFLRGGHGALLPEDFEARLTLYKSIAEFVLAGTPAPLLPTLVAARQSRVAVWLSKLNWLVWLLLLVVLTIPAVYLVGSPLWFVGYLVLLVALLYSS